MSDRNPSSFREFESTATQDYKRIRALSKDLRARFEAIGLHQSYCLFTAKPMKGWAKPGIREPDERGGIANRKMLRPPEYPETRSGEDPRRYRQRVEKFRDDNRAYHEFAEEFVSDGIERLVEKIEALTSDGEYWPQPKRSELQIAEQDWQPCELPIYAALLAGRDWKQFLPKPKPVPARTQLSLF